MRAWNLAERLWQDARYAMRIMRRGPGFTAVVVLSLALGIGANTAVFSLINTLMLRLLPVRDPGQLVELLQHYPGEPRGNGYWSWASFQHYREHNHVLAGLIAATGPAPMAVRGERGGLDAEVVNAQAVDGDFFRVLGVRPALGRLIGPEDQPGAGAAPAVAVVSWSLWKNKFGLDPKILGKPLVAGNVPVTVVGVTPPGFFGLLTGSRTDIWLPVVPSASTRLALVARLKPDVSMEQALAEMTVLYRFTIEERASASQDPLVRQMKVEIAPAGAGLSLLRDQFGKPLLALMAVVGLVLLIACTNVAGLLLARGAARQKEMAVRVSLGAGRLRLAGQVLTECLLLSGMGTLAGVALAYFGAGALIRILASGRPIIGLPQPLEIPLRPDLPVLLFTAGVAVLGALLFGLAPAWHAFASLPADSLRGMGRAGETRSRRRFGSSLVVAQVALSVVLLSAASLFVGRLVHLKRVDLGFQRDHVLLVTLDPSRSGYNDARLSRGYQQLLSRLEAMPGVRSVSLSAPTPLSGAGASAFAAVEGLAERPEDRRYISVSWVAPRYFETLGIPLVAGRDFRFEDAGSERAAILNQAMARYYFRDSNPLGKRVTLDHRTGSSGTQTYEIVGVVGDAKYHDIEEPVNRIIYLPAFGPDGVNARSFLLRTNIDPRSVALDVRRAVREVLKTVPISRMTTLREQIDASIVPERLMAALSGVFGALGATLAAIGLYGLLAFTVARRITEFGIRLALGATGGQLGRMVVRHALSLLAAGLILGAPVAVWCKDLASRLVPGAEMPTVMAIAASVAGMVVVALAAAILPARRASRVDPTQALRYE